MNVVAFVPDLMDRSKVSAAAPGVTFVATAPDLLDAATGADLVLVDLSRPGVLDVLDRLAPARVIGFGSHVDRDLLARAEASGCEAMPRSAFFARVGSLLG